MYGITLTEKLRKLDVRLVIYRRKYPRLLVSSLYLCYGTTLSCFAAGISVQTITNIRTEFKEKNGDFSSPLKKYVHPGVRKDADQFDRDAIRRKIHSLYKNKENLSLTKILVCG